MFIEKKCPICGKKITRINFSTYIYKIGSKYYCGWNCYHKAKIKLEKEKKND